MKRRDLLKAGVAACGAGLLGARLSAQNPNSALLKYLCPPDGALPDMAVPSPKSRPFVMPLNIMPIMQPVASLDPPPDPLAHQLYDKYPPKKLYEIYEQEFGWIYHSDPPYGAGTWGWGFNGITPGPTYDARYGEPILVRRHNNLPTVSNSKVTFALPSTSSHLHNGHTASESDGNPQDWIDSGEFWDHHYCNFPSHNDANERLHTLWYHDHRMDFTASNVYAGLSGVYRLFDDDEDTGDETTGWHLPSGEFDVPMLLHDVLFDQDGQVVFDPFNTDGILGDKYTVNRRIQPFFEVKRRKYRLRVINGGPSRFYQLYLKNQSRKNVPFQVITGDGNFLPWPLWTESVYLSVAQRVDIIVDFADYAAGEQLYLWNGLLQTSGKGPTTRMVPYAPDDSVIRFDVRGGPMTDPSRVPNHFRNLPKVHLDEVRRRRTFVFDYNGGLWTVNGQVFDPNRIDAKIEQGTAEIWTLRNQGKNWSHPIHSHFTEYILLEVNGVPLLPVPDPCYTQERRYADAAAVAAAGCEVAAADYQVVQTEDLNLHHQFEIGRADRPLFQDPKNPAKLFMGGRRRDIATLNESDELVVYMRWEDFLGKHVMHCHNVVHEDHAMMIRWDIVKPGEGDSNKEEQDKVKERLLSKENRPHLEPRPNTGTQQDDQNPQPSGQKQPTNVPPAQPPPPNKE